MGFTTNNTENITQGAGYSDNISSIPLQYVLLGVFLFLIVAITIIGNVMVLIAVTQDRRLRTSFNYYIVNLAVTDVAVAVTAMSFYTIDNILGYWPFGEFMCGVWIFFDYGMTFASVFTLILISLDRFWSVTWSLHYRKHNTRRKSLIFIAFSWIFMLCLWLPACISDRLKHSRPGVCKWEPSENRTFVIIVAALGHHGACIVMLLCYLKVFQFMQKRIKVRPAMKPVPAISHSHVLHAEFTLQTADICTQDDATSAAGSKKFLQVPQNGKSRENEKENCPSTSSDPHSGTNSMAELWNQPEANYIVDSATHVNTSKNSQRNTVIKAHKERKERRVFITLTYVVIGYMICWVPFHIVFDVSAINPELVPETVYTITFWMTYINSTINPFLYNFSSAEFRHAFKRMMCRCK